MNLYPGDVLLINIAWGWLDPLVRWLVGYWNHCCLVYRTDSPPLIIEATPGQGIEIAPLRVHKGRQAMLLRANSYNWQEIGCQASLCAEAWATESDTGYDYMAVVRWVIPRLILAKLGIAYHHWHRDRWHLCSELVEITYFEAGYPLFVDSFIPLPSDFLLSPKLRAVWAGIVDALLPATRKDNPSPHKRAKEGDFASRELATGWQSLS